MVARAAALHLHAWSKGGRAGRVSVGAVRTARVSAMVVLAALVVMVPALAADGFDLRLNVLARDGGPTIPLDLHGPLGLFFLGLVFFSTFITIFHLRADSAWRRRDGEQRAEIAQLTARVDRADVMLSARRQFLMSWRAAEDEPEIEGDTSIVIETPTPRRVVRFGGWLAEADAARLTEKVAELRQNGTGFRLSAAALNGAQCEMEGRAIAGCAVLSVAEVTGDRRVRQEVEARYQRLVGEIGALHAVLDGVPQMIWLRTPDGRLAWVNAAYAAAVDARNANDAVARALELLDGAQRDHLAAAANASSSRLPVRLQAIVAGQRTKLDVCLVETSFGSGGVAQDAGEIETMQAALRAEIDAHVRTLQQVPIAIAIFDRRRTLRFYNPGYAELWKLDTAFLDSRPSDDEILDRLREARRLPEPDKGDFRSWKKAVLSAYASIDTLETRWDLPDRRTLRVIITPTSDGGVTYLFEDLTERNTLEAEFKALAQVRNETLDSLKEGVAVFGLDGRLKLWNPAFMGLWGLHPESVHDHPHVDQVIQQARVPAPALWAEIRGLVTGVHEVRDAWHRRVSLADGTVVDATMTPLPDGAALLTFVDMTAAVNSERMLHERNQALEFANEVKANLVNDVSYELRPPLQNVIGYITMLSDGIAGPMSERQQQYADNARREAEALQDLVNDIFAVANVSTGQLALNRETVVAVQPVKAALERLSPRLARARITLETDLPDATGTFVADPERFGQIVFHLILNAVEFSRPGDTIRVGLARQRDALSLTVADTGRGMPPELVARIAAPAAPAKAAAHRGVGLGLSLVKAFVGLHGGEVSIATAPGEGTTVTCRFPLDGAALRPEAPAASVGRARRPAAGSSAVRHPAAAAP
jgi:signal transduction histidine kinase